jgi:hypothetical protein
MAIVRLHKPPASEVFCTHRGGMIASPDFSFPDYPERDPRELRIHHMEQVLRKAAGFFRAMGSNTMARESELSWSWLVGQVGSEVKVYSGC